MSYDADPTERPGGPICLHALLGALGRTPIWLLCWAATLALALVLALPWVGWFADATAHRFAPGEVLGSLDETFRFDHRGALGALRERSVETLGVLALVAMLLGAFAAGGWLQVLLERTSGHSVRRFFWGGARYFWRFVRVWLLTLVLLAVLSWLVLGWPWRTLVAGFVFGAPGGETEGMTSEWSAVWLGWLQAGAHATGFALILVWADYVRTRLAMHDSTSAFLAGLSTAGLLFRHPVRTLRPLLLIVALEALVLFGAGWAVDALQSGLPGARPGGAAGPGTWHGVALLALVGQVALMWRAIARGARYHAAVSVSRDLVPPLPRPDPWARRVGGPGGPQYPIDTSDEYGVSL